MKLLIICKKHNRDNFMNDLLSKIAYCVEVGKSDVNTPYPPELNGQEGASELTKLALKTFTPQEILNEALIIGMKNIGDKFAQGKSFIPNLLIAAKAMNAAMVHLKPYYEKGEIKNKGTIVVGTVMGDLHDIGKNIVKMVMEGDGWKVIDLGIDVNSEKFLNAIKENLNCIVGLSAMLTTTMLNMEKIVKSIKEQFPSTKIYIGGAPVSGKFNEQIGADGYFHDPNSLVNHLSKV